MKTQIMYGNKVIKTYNFLIPLTKDKHSYVWFEEESYKIDSVCLDIDECVLNISVVKRDN